MLKKTLKIAGIILLLLLIFAFSAPFLFRGKIVSIVKTQINKNLNARVDFSDVDISLFRHFPRLAVGLDSLQVVGNGEFSTDTLISAKQIDVSLDLLSVISGNNMKIHSIHVEQPRIHAIVHKNGHANWQITKPDPGAKDNVSTAPKSFSMQLQKYSISDAYISYADESANMSCEIAGLSHEGSGDFTSDLFTLQTKTNTVTLSFRYGSIPYIVNAKAVVNASFQVDNKSGKYSFNVNEMSVNDLKLNTEGFFQIVNDSSYNMDIKFNAPSADFKSVLSMIPALYRKDFASIRTSGETALSGSVKGLYDSRHIPSYHIKLDVKNGSFQYSDLPKPVKNINVSLAVDNPDGVTDHTVVNIARGHLEMDEAPFDFRLLLKTPVSDPYIDVAAKGRLDLARVSEMVKLENGAHLTGLLNADVNARGNLSAIQKQQADRFNAAGNIDLSDFLYASNSYPGGIRLSSMKLAFTPRNVTLSELVGEYLKTSFNADGVINNLLAYMLKNQPLDGSLNVKADQMNLNDWMGSMPSDTATAARTAGTPASAPFAVPAHINFVINAGVDKLHYDNLDMQNVSGGLRLADETVKLVNVKADALDGSMLINGSYSTRNDKRRPEIAMSYDVKNLDIQKTFYAFNTVQKLMPAGKFIDGKLNSQMSMNGRMGDNMQPDLTTLAGDGSLVVADGMVKNFEPLDKLAQTLNLSQLRSMAIKDIKTYFSFKNGKVVVDPFNVKAKDIDMEIGGSHGFDQSLDYVIAMKVPRAMLGDQANSLVNSSVAQVNSKAVPVKMSDMVSLSVKMGGTIANPLLRTDLKEALNAETGGLRQQAVSLVQARVDSAKQPFRDTARAVSKQVVKTGGEAHKRLMKGLFNKKKSQ
ncbi:MAG TPA: AsmA-like C-terminal region-containing protein [Puia sp.]|nr:AsmA-like C-terminal region-containing protein [Puia sp.]